MAAKPPLRLTDPLRSSTTSRANELWAEAQALALEEVHDYIEQLELLLVMGDQLAISLAPVGIVEVIKQTQHRLMSSRQTLTALLERLK